jgi:hypothetical protein
MKVCVNFVALEIFAPVLRATEQMECDIVPTTDM